MVDVGVAKDRAAPFSRKHRRYWMTVLGGMVVIGVVNVAIGLWSYKRPTEPQRIELVLHDAAVIDATGTLAASELPAAVMRAFAVKYPRTIPSGAIVVDEGYRVMFPPGKGHKSATFRADGTFVTDE